MSNLVTTIYSLLFTVVLTNSSSASKADKLPSPPIPPFLQNFFSSNPVFAWVFWLFSAIAIGIAALAVFTGNLQKIIDFVKNNFSRTKVGVNNDKSIRDWLIEQLPKIYPGLSKAVAENWINNQQLIP